MSRKAFFTQSINPNTLFLGTMACLLPFLFLRSLLFIFIEMLLFITLNYLKKGKIKLLPSIIIIVSLVFFNLLTPVGKVLFRIDHFPITLTALTIGLRKGLILTGMVQISKFAMGRNLHFPGKAGILVGRTFACFDRITAMKIDLAPSQLITSIDDALTKVYSTMEMGTEEHPAAVRTTKYGKIFLLAMISLCWILFLIQGINL